MESIGEKLRTTRKQKGYTVEQVARDTHIAKRFIESLEAEDFDQFPGEPYLIGFLRTYSEFLELDPQETLTLYKNMKIQETPAPMDELIVRKSPRPWVLGSLGVLVVAALGIGAYFLFTSGVLNGGTDRAGQSVQTSEQMQPREVEGEAYVLEEVFLEQRFYVGDVVSVPVGGENQPVTIEGVADNLSIQTPQGGQTVTSGGEEALDLDGDGHGDVRLLVRNLDPSTNPPSAVLRFDRVLQQPLAQSLAQTDADLAASGDAVGEESGTPGIGSTNVASREQSAVVLRSAEGPQAFGVNIDFRGYSYFRAQVDDEPREEQYVQNGDAFQANPDQEIRLWLSNAGAAQAAIGGRSVSLGDAGVVASYLVTWVPNRDEGTFQLELVPLY
ncbi:MAG: helix-turn-helix domain-containing protein [Spirochaetes bacterium]|jgi:cytoskeletal protein RodZ|nr:helix-turn-helix domain-containing protein [Spirochaetota bacterium]